ncbi:MAG: ribonuclease HI [bacterium]
MNSFKIYTDGGCDKNPGGKGGWAFFLQDGEHCFEQSGWEENTTNNRMELTAALKALDFLNRHLAAELHKPAVELFTDSQYLSRGMKEWLPSWMRQHWTLKGGSPVKNQDLWQQLYELSRRFKITWTWIQGHSGDPYNTRVDQLVKAEIRGKPKPNSALTEAKPGILRVKLKRQQGLPVSIVIIPEGKKSGVECSWEHLPKLIEDLVGILREGEES